jgi:hypothetical protein
MIKNITPTPFFKTFLGKKRTFFSKYVKISNQKVFKQ